VNEGASGQQRLKRVSGDIRSIALFQPIYKFVRQPANRHGSQNLAVKDLQASVCRTAKVMSFLEDRLEYRR
jgi:hypothetical protein